MAGNLMFPREDNIPNTFRIRKERQLPGWTKDYSITMPANSSWRALSIKSGSERNQDDNSIARGAWNRKFPK